MRLWILFIGLAVALLVPFLIWGESFDAALGGAAGARWLEQAGGWAWAAGIGLLVADLLLPVPSTAVISALGYIYGALVGGLVGAAGSFLAGLVAYLSCRLVGERAARWLLGGKDPAAAGGAVGAWGIVLSRWLPLLPEVVACMAGLTRMPARVFLLALACGSLPMGFAYASIGAAGVERPVFAVAASAVVPAVLWLGARRLVRRRRESGDAQAH